jgi:S-methylmethionine-dependent homocysteine/selenocysteine methylase
MRDLNMLSQLQERVYLHYVGSDTDIIFNKGIHLPGFASYPLLETSNGRDILRSYSEQLLQIGREEKCGIILDSATWVANRDRGAKIGYSPEKLAEINKASIDLISEVRRAAGDPSILLCAQMGPRGDGYSPGDQMTIDQATSYHSEQMKTLAKTEADFVGGFTICYAEEAAGIIRAGQQYDIPVVIAFTIETDGRLPTGQLLSDAIGLVDEATDQGALYFLINCTHPDHINNALTDDAWLKRLRGVVVNASRCSHAELDEALELDVGDPDELGRQLAELKRKYQHFTIFGVCCGTDFRHMKSISKNVSSERS